MIYKFIQLLLIYLLTIPAAYSDPYGEEGGCDLLAPSSIIKNNKKFTWNHQIDIYLTGKKTLEIKGYLLKEDKKRKRNIGIFHFDAGHSSLGGINLLDFNKLSKYEKFSLYKNQNVEFIPIKKYAKTKFVSGGFLDKKILQEKCSIDVIDSSQIKCIINELIPKLNCIKKKGSLFLVSSKENTLSIKKELYDRRKSSKNISDVISSSYYKPKSLKDIFIIKTAPVLPVNSKNNRISNVFDNEKTNISSHEKIKKKLCSIRGNEKNIGIIKKHPDNFIFAGIINRKKVNAYWYDPNLSINPSKENFTINLSSLKNKYVRIKPHSYKKIKTNKENSIIPIQFSSLPDMPKISLSKKKYKKPIMRIIVIGDPASISISGLEKMETILSKKSKGYYQWVIHWYNINPNGSLKSKKEFSSFLKLIIFSKKEKYTRKILLPEEEKFKIFLNSFQNKILKYKKNIGYVLWVKHGYQLPLITPDIFDDFIKKIHNKAKISRFKNEKPYKWLYILSGNMPGGSKTLLEEPMNRATPTPGQIDEEEKVNLTHRRLLKRPERLALSLDLAGKRSVKSLLLELDIPPENLFVDAKQVLKKTGLLIPIDHIEDDNKTKGISKDILKSIRKKDYSIASRNKCTHVFFSGKDMGLSWIK